jgi:hypothetical protein
MRSVEKVHPPCPEQRKSHFGLPTPTSTIREIALPLLDAFVSSEQAGSLAIVGTASRGPASGLETAIFGVNAPRLVNQVKGLTAKVKAKQFRDTADHDQASTPSMSSRSARARSVSATTMTTKRGSPPVQATHWATGVTRSCTHDAENAVDQILSEGNLPIIGRALRMGVIPRPRRLLHRRYLLGRCWPRPRVGTIRQLCGGLGR